MSAIRQFYDKLILLPLDEKAPSLYSHYLITASTLERVGKPCHIRVEKNGFILQDVIEAVQQRPDMLDVFCNLLRDVCIAAELAQLIKGRGYHTLSRLVECSGLLIIQKRGLNLTDTWPLTQHLTVTWCDSAQCTHVGHGYVR